MRFPKAVSVELRQALDRMVGSNERVTNLMKGVSLTTTVGTVFTSSQHVTAWISGSSF